MGPQNLPLQMISNNMKEVEEKLLFLESHSLNQTATLSPFGVFFECIFASALSLSQQGKVWMAICTGCLPCARHFSKHFKCICPFSPCHSARGGPFVTAVLQVDN